MRKWIFPNLTLEPFHVLQRCNAHRATLFSNPLSFLLSQQPCNQQRPWRPYTMHLRRLAANELNCLSPPDSATCKTRQLNGAWNAHWSAKRQKHAFGAGGGPLIAQPILEFAHRGMSLFHNGVRDDMALFISRLFTDRSSTLSFRIGIPGDLFFRSFIQRHTKTAMYRRANLQGACMDDMSPRNLAHHYAKLKKNTRFGIPPIPWAVLCSIQRVSRCAASAQGGTNTN